MSLSEIFNRQQYLNLETFRKNGNGVKTPVWFVIDGDKVYVRTLAASGKVKRIRNQQRVFIAPCKVDGTLLGDWLEATARVVDDPEMDRKIDRLLGKKYGLVKILFGLASSLRGQKNTVIEIQAIDQ
ncbi:MAG: PPOX class F420-dependent oxidoreductase [Chloroflexi bacterium]|nr:PPOX class F420-dependent oxidoreductase [Chloroflexota bacterium]